ncbi:hormogonium polysaccharide biosynthesis glycosyltransferase HpsE [Egbenema bharatensis]|uniref:hormogonium polysaccharide biosynthesis glycosyltransferase HpsE n=1 Tax=Egbenema bharatensis TaxID=3463334 RepID=UPI003A8A5333
MDIDFTVAIPTYNGAKTLPLVLERLKAQVNTESIAWEVIVVDNNSSDQTAEVVHCFQKHWLPDTPLNYCLEPRQGSAYARQRAVKEARGNLVGFLDDDNLPAADWVAAACQFGAAHPEVGSYGGQILGQYEVEPPAGFDKVKKYLVIRKYANEVKPFEPERLRLPPGAGLVVRRQAWLDCMPDRFTRAHRGGHDYEISLHLYRHGWKVWYNPAQKIDHLIPAWRMERNYLVRIARTYGLCTCEIRLILAQPWQRPFLLIKSFLGSIRRLLGHLIRYGDRVYKELDLACELAFFWGGVMSPFYYLKKQLIR